MNIKRLPFVCSLLCVALALGGCNKQPQQQKAEAPEVGVYTLKAQDIVLSSDLPGRTASFRGAEVRPQVNGIIQKRLFVQGSYVKKGQQLYQIDPRIYEADVQRAEANRDSARNLAKRYTKLLKSRAISRQQYDDAVAAWKQAEADLKTAQVNLQYTRVLAPISGRIGRSSVTEGALVSADQANALATINQLDPIYVDVSQASTDMLRLRREVKSGQLQMAGPNQIKSSLILEDGTRYDQSGVLKFAEVTVDPSTGGVILRAQFPNPDGVLLPGMFVHARLTEGVRKDAILLPQQGLVRDYQGNPMAWVVSGDNTVTEKPIKVSRTVGNQWLVEQGLKSGDVVVTEGLQRLSPDIKIKPVAATNVSTVSSYTPDAK